MLTGVTGAALAGMLVGGVAAASHDDSAPKPDRLLAQQQDMAALNQKAPEKKAPSKTPAESRSKSAAKDSKASAPKAAKKKADKGPKAILSGSTTASYFWDDGSGINGDTGAPASGKPMQKGMFASPSWPMNTKVKVTYKGRSVTGFVGDRGPGAPSHNGVMLDLDTYTFRYLLDGGKPSSKYDAGTGEGHLQGVKWEVLSWGSGAGTKGDPQPLG
ncbi:septal ring lytic transglycosylase RlpA family protein [Actinomadura verrucosospora]|uniref:septal ring lytic transglycosylase RlpA family protein n=1 Tax=Actinomadura verrucosospora TaxID=46165 RepID=UPI001FE68624|nr:septal ring lytic transglycosylase RlpA family protein [Actinomadura verrucosospora]